MGLNIRLVGGCLGVTVPVVGQAPQTMAVGQQQPDPSTLVYVALSPRTSARTRLLHLLLPGGGGRRAGGVGEADTESAGSGIRQGMLTAGICLVMWHLAGFESEEGRSPA